MTNRIIDEPDVSAGGIYDLLCDGMHDIVVKCSIILADCYGPEDMLDMRNGQLKLTQKVSETVPIINFFLTNTSSVFYLNKLLKSRY